MKNILLHAPTKVYGIICSYPLIFKIFETFKDARIHIIAREGQGKYFEFFPFTVSIHSFPEKKNNFLGVHHFAVNLHEVFNVDIYFDLEGSFLSALMGKSFGAKDRVGFKNKASQLLLTHKVEPGLDLLDRKYLSLIEEYENTSFLDFTLGREVVKLNESDDNVIPLFTSVNDKSFILVFIDDLVDAVVTWDSLFPLFEHVSFIFWGLGDHEKNQELTRKYDQGRGLFQYTTADHYSDLNSLIEQSNAVLTNQEWMGNLASIKNKKVFSFVKDISGLRKFRHILFQGAYIEYTENSLIKLYGEDNAFVEVRVPSDISDFITEIIYPPQAKEG